MTADHQHDEYVGKAAVAGLAREVEALRRAVRAVAPRQDTVEAQVKQLAEQVAGLAKATARKTGGEKVAAPSWLVLPPDLGAVTDVLDPLLKWLTSVYLRYADAVLPDCWLWHPDVVEELVCLMHTWIAAYDDENASAIAAGDWHDRYRPGAVRRIKNTAGACSLEAHAEPQPARRVPLVEAAESVLTWWSASRTQPAPTPTDAHLRAAMPTPNSWGARR